MRREKAEGRAMVGGSEDPWGRRKRNMVRVGGEDYLWGGLALG